MNITNHQIIQEYLQEIQGHLRISSLRSKLWAQIQEDILEHVQDAYDNRDPKENQGVSLILNSILDELGPPPTIAQAYLSANPVPFPKTSKGRSRRLTQKLKHVPKYLFVGLTFPLRKSIKFISIHKKIMIPYFLIIITLYSALFAAQPIYHEKHTTPMGLIDPLGRDISSTDVIDIEIVRDHLVILEEDYSESRLYFYELNDNKHPSYRSTINIGWEASSLTIFDNLAYVISQNLNSNENGSTYQVHVYNISDFSDVTLFSNFSSGQIPNLGYDAEIVVINSSLFFRYDSKSILFHALANHTEISLLSQHNITKEGRTYPESITHAEIYNDLVFLSTDDDFYTFQYVNNSEFVQLHTVDLDVSIINFRIDHDIAYIAAEYSEVVSLNITNFFKPQLIEIFQSDHSTYRPRNYVHLDLADGNLFYSSEYNIGISQIDVKNPRSMSIIGKYGKIRRIQDLKVYEEVIYVVDSTEGLQIWNLEVFSGGLLFLKLTTILNWTALISVISLGASFVIFYIRKHALKKGR